MPTGQQATPAACNGVVVIAYGYVGCAKSNTSALPCPWDEWFVIASDRTIWHAWQNSRGWLEMPNNGRADDTHRCFVNGNSQRQVEVDVTNNGTWYGVNDHGTCAGGTGTPVHDRAQLMIGGKAHGNAMARSPGNSPAWTDAARHHGASPAGWWMPHAPRCVRLAAGGKRTTRAGHPGNK